MAIFPKIQSPCPYRSQISTLMEGDMCRMCSRQVVDLTLMTDGERRAVIEGCAEEVCVSYRLPAAAVAAIAAFAAAAAPLPAAAQDVPEPELIEIIVGGIKDKSKVEYVEDAADQAIPELPVIEDEQPRADANAVAADQDAAAQAEALKARPAP